MRGQKPAWGWSRPGRWPRMPDGPDAPPSALRSGRVRMAPDSEDELRAANGAFWLFSVAGALSVASCAEAPSPPELTRQRSPAVATDNGLAAITGLSAHNGLDTINGQGITTGLDAHKGLDVINGLNAQ